MKILWLCCALLCLTLPLPACAQDSWAVYWYVCGSDLETENGAATTDIAEMLRSRLPADVKVVVQTGGARKWQEFGISARNIDRYVYHNGDLERVARLPQASMGSRNTLQDFLRFCKDNYPADKKIFIFWDHGGGSVNGLCNDQNHGMEALSLNDVTRAFAAVFPPAPASPPFEIIGFDTCLMGTVETATSLHGLARYMVASQEVEPAYGWEYTGWLNALGRNTSIHARDLGKIMCDTYMQGCRAGDADDTATLSVIDLDKIPQLNLTLNALGLEAVTAIADDQTFYGVLGRGANKAENYANSRSENYSNMMDIGSWVSALRPSLPNFAESVLQALHEAVVYQVSGRYRHPSGLSCYYPYDGDADSYKTMLRQGNVTSFLVVNGLQMGFVDRDWAVKHLERISDEITAAVDASDDAPAVSPAPPAVTPPAPTPQTEQGGGLLGNIFGGVSHDTAVSPPASPPAPAGPHADGTGIFGQIAGEAVQQAQQGADAPTPPPPAPAGNAGGTATAPATMTGLGQMFNTLFGQRPAENDNLSRLFGQVVTSVMGAVTPLQRQDTTPLEDFPVTITATGDAQIDLGSQRASMLQRVEFHLIYYDAAEDIMLDLGKDADLDADWEKGVFRDNFRGVWPALNGNLVYMELTAIKDDTFHYIVPVMLNGVRCNLIVVYDFTTERYSILGARRKSAETFDKSMIKLKKGDKITTIHYGMTINGKDEEFQEVEIDTFTLGDKILIEDTDLGDGTFVFMFAMTDVQNQTATSQLVNITVKGDEARMEVLE